MSPMTTVLCATSAALFIIVMVEMCGDCFLRFWVMEVERILISGITKGSLLLCVAMQRDLIDQVLGKIFLTL